MKDLIERPEASDIEYIPGFGWETDLTEENCTPELLAYLGGNSKMSTNQEAIDSLTGKDADSKAEAIKS